MNKKPNSGSFQKGIVPWNASRVVMKTCPHCGTEFKAKLSQDAIRTFCSKSCNAKAHPSPMKGRTTPPEVRAKQRAAKLGLRGEAHWNWKGGKRTERKKAMARDEYIQWRKAVFERDNHSCIACGERGGELNADHIKPWSTHPDLRYEIDNGRTLCVRCHRETDTWGARANRRVNPAMEA